MISAAELANFAKSVTGILFDALSRARRIERSHSKVGSDIDPLEHWLYSVSLSVKLYITVHAT